MIEALEEFVDGSGPKCIPDLGAIERYAYGALGDGTVVGDICEVLEPGNRGPLGLVEDLRNHAVRLVLTAVAAALRASGPAQL